MKNWNNINQMIKVVACLKGSIRGIERSPIVGKFDMGEFIVSIL